MLGTYVCVCVCVCVPDMTPEDWSLNAHLHFENFLQFEDLHTSPRNEMGLFDPKREPWCFGAILIKSSFILKFGLYALSTHNLLAEQTLTPQAHRTEPWRLLM